MSARTSGVAVAVSAIVNGSPSCLRTSPRRRYSGRKSCPHWLMQCASSIASSDNLRWVMIDRNPGALNLSGAT